MLMMGRTAFEKRVLGGISFNTTGRLNNTILRKSVCFAFIAILTHYCRTLLSSCARLMSVLFCNMLLYLFSTFHRIQRKIQSLNYTCSKLEILILHLDILNNA